MSQEGTIALLKDAYQLEVEGWLFYRGLLDSLPKGEVRDVFVYLAEQEQKHQSYIGGEISRLQEGKS
ncbi:MAG TPA: ferritin family protein, partial [Candidatus Cryosericum sp.]